MGIARTLIIISLVIYYIIGTILVISGLFAPVWAALICFMLGILYLGMGYYLTRIKRRIDQGDIDGVKGGLTFMIVISIVFLNLISGILLLIAYYKLKNEKKKEKPLPPPPLIY